MEELRKIDRRGHSVLDGLPGDLLDRFEDILNKLMKIEKDLPAIDR
jgi:hypothetical protein